MKKQNKSNWQIIVFAAIAVFLAFGAFDTAVAQEKKSAGERYGSREPRTCADMKTPAKGVITAALAAKYFICKAEGIDGQYLYLVENVKVEVGGGRPYNPNMDLNVPEIDVKFPLYPIRGSLTKYQCKDPQTDYIKISGRTCNRTEQPNAKGFCYKTTFGDWSCYMMELFGKNEDYFPDVAPPGGKKTTDNKEATNDKPDDTTTTKQTDETKNETKDESATGKDENGFVKPDFSEMKKYFEIVKMDYDFSLNKFTLLVKMTKATSVCDWYLTFYDGDGVKMRENSFAGSTCSPEIGEPTRIYSYTPAEREMKGVTRIAITRKIR